MSDTRTYWMRQIRAKHDAWMRYVADVETFRGPAKEFARQQAIKAHRELMMVIRGAKAAGVRITKPSPSRRRRAPDFDSVLRQARLSDYMAVGKPGQGG